MSLVLCTCINMMGVAHIMVNMKVKQGMKMECTSECKWRCLSLTMISACCCCPHTKATTLRHLPITNILVVWCPKFRSCSIGTPPSTALTQTISVFRMEQPDHLLRSYRKYKAQEKSLLRWVFETASLSGHHIQVSSALRRTLKSGILHQRQRSRQNSKDALGSWLGEQRQKQQKQQKHRA